METIKIRLNQDVIDNVVYSYVLQIKPDTAITYDDTTYANQLAPADEDVTEDSPAYILIKNYTYYTTPGYNEDGELKEGIDLKVDTTATTSSFVTGGPTYHVTVTSSKDVANDVYIQLVLLDKEFIVTLPMGRRSVEVDTQILSNDTIPSPTFIMLTPTGEGDYDYSLGIRNLYWYEKRMYYTSEALKLFIPLSNNFETNLYQEELINDMFVNDIKAGVIPEMIDMEKVVFTPAFQSNTSVFDAKEIVFNFHFSERDKDNGWQLVTGNTAGWNNITVGTKLTSQILRKSDKLGFLGFDNDDVRYQTSRLKKSFVRLSYYTTNNPLDQKLLTYSTMFIDSGELYGKFMNNRVDTPDFGVETDDEPDSTNSNRLDSRLTIVDKNNINKSSEGFYLYLFNDEVTEKSPEKDIYMKVEFNSAAYGLTVPVCKPYCDNSGHIKPMPFDEFFNSLFIRIRLKYIASEKRFVYIIPEDGLTTQVDIQNRRIIFNLFEVKFDDSE